MFERLFAFTYCLVFFFSFSLFFTGVSGPLLFVVLWLCAFNALSAKPYCIIPHHSVAFEVVRVSKSAHLLRKIEKPLTRNRSYALLRDQNLQRHFSLLFKSDFMQIRSMFVDVRKKRHRVKLARAVFKGPTTLLSVRLKVQQAILRAWPTFCLKSSGK